MRRDNIGDARFENRDEIELSFAHDRTIRLDQAAFRLMQTKEDASFPEKRRLGRVQIFGALRLLFEHAAAEGDDFAHIIVNREHDAVAETVVTPAIASDHQSGFGKRLRLIFGKDRFQILPAVRGIAQSITRGDLARHSASPRRWA